MYAGGTFTNVNNLGTVLTAANNIAEYLNPGWPFTSVGTDDGWVLESAAGSAKGGSLNATAGTFNLGDDAANRQYRSILHFDTSVLGSILPPTAKIINVTLRIKKNALVGSNPFASLQTIKVDIRKGAFAGNPALQAGDFQGLANLNGVGTFTNAPLAGGWYAATLNSSAYPYINLTGTTEFRLEFQMGSNANSVADYLSFYSGDFATSAYRPVLSIAYIVP